MCISVLDPACVGSVSVDFCVQPLGTKTKTKNNNSFTFARPLNAPKRNAETHSVQCNFSRVLCFNNALCCRSCSRYNSFHCIDILTNQTFFLPCLVLESAWRVPEWQSMKEALAQVRSTYLIFVAVVVLFSFGVFWCRVGSTYSGPIGCIVLVVLDGE